MKHEGLSAHRLASNPLEKAFAKAWKERAPSTLAYLLHGQGTGNQGDLTQQEATVAATMIQWLGSPVGQGFLEEVYEAALPKTRSHPR